MTPPGGESPAPGSRTPFGVFARNRRTVYWPSPPEPAPRCRLGGIPSGGESRYNGAR